MTEKNTKTNENIKSTFENSTEKNQPSDDFRETLLKSGLDISAFQFESENKNLADDVNQTLDLEKNKITKNPLSSPLSPVENHKDALPKLGRQHFTAIIGIVVIIVLQAAFQFSFVQEEHLQSAENLIKNHTSAGQNIEKAAKIEISEIKEASKIEPKIEYKKPDAEVLITPKKNASKFQREIRQIPSRTAFRKKEPRNPNAERLRRAEKILTGV